MGCLNRSLLFLIFILTPVFTIAQSEEEIIINITQQFFDAMNKRDTTVARNILLPDGQIFSIREDSTGVNIKKRSHADFINNLTMSDKELLETMSNPKVMIHDRVAILWAKYKFYLDGEYSHGGVDAFSFLKTAQGWKISGVIYNIE